MPKVYLYTCPRGCAYSPGYQGKRPIGDQQCPNCRAQMKQHVIQIPGQEFGK